MENEGVHNKKDRRLISDLKTLIGVKIRINHIEGVASATGLEGVVKSVDDLGQLHGTWNSIAVLYFEDDIDIIEG